MSNVLNLIIENWRIVAIGAAILSYFGYDKAKALFSTIKLPKLPKLPTLTISPKPVVADVVDYKAVEAADVAAIALLRDRAVKSKNDALLKEIKDVSAQFFDLHCIGNADHADPIPRKSV